MLHVPFFLRECDKFPSPPLGYKNERCCGSRRAFEFLVSLKKKNNVLLLETQNAADAELFFQLLQGENQYNNNAMYLGNIIWLSEDIYITEAGHPLIFSKPFVYAFRVSISNSPCTPCDNNRQLSRFFYICKDSGRTFSSLGDIGCEISTILQLLANHKSITEIKIIPGPRGGSSWKIRKKNEPSSFPASLDALKAFVGDAQCPRELHLENAGLSIDQWRMIFIHCSKHVALSFLNCEMMNDDGKMESLMEAMKQNQCTARLRFLDFYELPSDLFRDFMAALESTTSLKDLYVGGIMIKDGPSTLISLCEAISRNSGLEHLDLKARSENAKGIAMSNSQWEYICRATTSHATLKTLNLDVAIAESSSVFSRREDDLLIPCISNNTVLCKLNLNCGWLYSPGSVLERAVRPVLERNRIRAIAQIIQQETDATRRQKLFTFVLQCDPVFQRPACRFMLLRENFDLWKELSSWSATTSACSNILNNGSSHF